MDMDYDDEELDKVKNKKYNFLIFQINKVLDSRSELKKKIKPCTLPEKTQELVKLIFDHDMFNQGFFFKKKREFKVISTY